MKKIKISARGRTCKFSHCKKALSIYNHERYCHVHRQAISSGSTMKALALK